MQSYVLFQWLLLISLAILFLQADSFADVHYRQVVPKVASWGTTDSRNRNSFLLFVNPVPVNDEKYAPLAKTDDDDDDDDDKLLSSFRPNALLLQQVFPAMLSYRREFGHVNIPLGSKEGRICETLRRMQIQQKLNENDVAFLDRLGFRWHSLEDVYRTADFDELLARLIEYAQQNDGDLSPPKKYDRDPELGAWVTGIRRIGQEQLEADHVQRLNALGFEWVSQRRRCGSGFMKQYRQILDQIEEQKKKQDDDDDGVKNPLFWLEDGHNRRWVQAQQLAHEKGNLSSTRVHYMEQLLGSDWATRKLDDA